MKTITIDWDEYHSDIRLSRQAGKAEGMKEEAERLKPLVDQALHFAAKKTIRGISQWVHAVGVKPEEMREQLRRVALEAKLIEEP